MGDAMQSGLSLSQEAEDRRRQFRTMLQAAEAEAVRDGTFTIDSVLAEIDSVIATFEQCYDVTRSAERDVLKTTALR